jgi:hypothetical protein
MNFINTKVFYRIHITSSLDRKMNHIHPYHLITHCFIKIRFDINFPTYAYVSQAF